MSRKSFSSLLVNSFCCQVPARCSSWGGRRAGENKQKLSPRPEVGTIMATLPLGRGAVPTPLGHRLPQLCEVRGKLWKTFTSFSGSFFTSCRWFCGILKKKRQRSCRDWQTTANIPRWMNCLHTGRQAYRFTLGRVQPPCCFLTLSIQTPVAFSMHSPRPWVRHAQWLVRQCSDSDLATHSEVLRQYWGVRDSQYALDIYLSKYIASKSYSLTSWNSTDGSLFYHLYMVFSEISKTDSAWWPLLFQVPFHCPKLLI